MMNKSYDILTDTCLFHSKKVMDALYCAIEMTEGPDFFKKAQTDLGVESGVASAPAAGNLSQCIFERMWTSHFCIG